MKGNFRSNNASSFFSSILVQFLFATSQEIYSKFIKMPLKSHNTAIMRP